MHYTQLGRSGLRVSRLCLGTMNFGTRTTEADSREIMNSALEEGINFFDTANVYGRANGFGTTESIIGRWLAEDPSRRDKVVLATKVYGDVDGWPNHGRLSALAIRSACDQSLARLNTDHIDLYQMHHIDRQTPWEEIWEAFDVLHQQGKVIYVGSSNFAGWNVAQAQETARQRHMLGLVSEQALYNLLERRNELELIPALMEYGLGLIPWSPLAGGLLGGTQAPGADARRSSPSAQELLAKHKAELDRYEQLCQAFGEPPGRVALAWLLAKPWVTAPIVGPRTLPQLKDALTALSLTLEDSKLAQLEEIFPPAGTAPEAYAW